MSKIVRRSDALARGLTDTEIQRYCRTRAWERLKPGVFVSRADFQALTPVARHRIIAEATILSARAPDTVLSHVSAAVIHGLDIWDVPLNRIHLTRNRTHGGSQNAVRVVHSSPYTPDEVTVVDGLAVTTLARTIADIARTVGFEQAVCIADHAARTQKLRTADVLEILDERPKNPGNRGARRVAEFMNGLSESVGESRSRVLLHALGHEPILQYPVGPKHDPFAFTDFYIAPIDTATEFDGRFKYGRLVDANDTPANVLWKEKVREDRIRNEGHQFVRWIWSELDTPDVIDQRLQQAAARHRGRGRGR